MIDFAYEDLETEAVKEREENEKYEAECAAEAFKPTPRSKSGRIAELLKERLGRMKDDGASTYNDRELCLLIIGLAEAIDER